MISFPDDGQRKPAFIAVAEAIATKIQDRTYEDRLPPIHALAGDYGVNFKTMNHAVAFLVGQGVLESRRKTGTYVAKDGRQTLSTLLKSSPQARQALFFMPADLHLHGKLYQGVIASLSRERHFPTVFHGRIDDAMLDDAMRLNPACLIVDAEWSMFPFSKLQDIAKDGTRVVILYCDEFDMQLDADYVLTDFAYGAYLATRHLIKLGHRRILHLTHVYAQPEPPPMIRLRTVKHHFIQGYRMALAEAGLENCEMIFNEPDDPIESGRLLRKIMAGPDHPTAIFANGDFRIMTHYAMFKSLGFKIPDDLALVGFYDTPHCQFCEVPLTSVSVKPEEMARLTAARAFSADGKRERIAVKPELVVRQSCGANR